MSYPNAPSHPSRIGSPWLLLSEQEIAEWMLRHPEFTSTEKVARMLCWLEREFSQTGTATGRSAAPAA